MKVIIYKDLITMPDKSFYRFILTPTGPALILQIGVYLCLFWMFSQVRNIFQDYSANQTCDLNNIFDTLSLITSVIIIILNLIGLAILFKQINFQYKNFRNS